jgi:hypothetical protein
VRTASRAGFRLRRGRWRGRSPRSCEPDLEETETDPAHQTYDDTSDPSQRRAPRQAPGPHPPFVEGRR